ncbi:DUF7537 family lipoprotein [Halosimplex salinum]|uniref:DUF7537 family lipoprotein n=1 Tax=Halosimplex salinum TaxID=1710538 RepID=UPI000F4A4CD9|nr:hypothetical protein [Halosimplex salinum]
MNGRTLAVVALVLLAGCSLVADGGDPDDPADTLTPAPVPTDSPTATPSPLPSGLSADGSVSPSALATAHIEAVVGTSYVWTEHSRVLTGDGDGNWSLARNRTRTIRLEDGRNYRSTRSQRVLWTGLGLEYLPTVERYADGQTRYVREGEGDDVTYHASDANDASDALAALAAGRVQAYLTVSNATVAAGRVDGGHRILVRSEGSGVIDGEYAANYTVEALVTGEGFVRRLGVSYRTERRGVPVRIEYDFTYREVGGVTVSPPAWIEEAREALDLQGGTPESEGTPAGPSRSN